MVEGALAGASLEDRLVLSNVGGEAAASGVTLWAHVYTDLAEAPVAIAATSLLDTVADLDGDGIAEWTGFDGEQTLLWPGAADGELTQADARAVYPDAFWLFGSPDLDGDGLADLVGRAPVAVYSGASTGSVASDEAIISVDTEGRAWVASGIPDVDGDGFADLAIDAVSSSTGTRRSSAPAGTYTRVSSTPLNAPHRKLPDNVRSTCIHGTSGGAWSPASSAASSIDSQCESGRVTAPSAASAADTTKYIRETPAIERHTSTSTGPGGFAQFWCRGADLSSRVGA
jgi:hypothetical protein